MDFCAGERMPAAELALRHERCRELLAQICPHAQGLLVFSRTAIYYLSGSMGNGILWLPLKGEAVLMVRKGLERCCLESPLTHMHSFKSYGEIAALCAGDGSPLQGEVAAEMWGLPWSLADMLQSRVKDVHFVPGDTVLARARAVKSPWELNKLRIAGSKHAEALRLLPRFLRAGLTEKEVAHALWDIFLQQGHHGMLRMGHYGQEVFLGRIAAGDNGNYPTADAGPQGLLGQHPALPFMGYAGSVWRKGQCLAVDTGFVFEGYHTDMCVIYWAGSLAEVPDRIRRAHQCCAGIMAELATLLTPGRPVAELWQRAQSMAQEAGFEQEFMGLSSNEVPWVGHGVGLTMDEWPTVGGHEVALEEHMVLALDPRIGLEGQGMVGVKQVFVVTQAGGLCMTGNDTALCCVED